MPKSETGKVKRMEKKQVVLFLQFFGVIDLNINITIFVYVPVQRFISILFSFEIA